MDCEEVRELYVADLTGDRPRPDGVDRHLATCAACRRELQALAATWAALDALPQMEPDPRVGRKLRRRVGWEAVRETLVSLERWQQAALVGVVGFALSVLFALAISYETLVAACREVVPALLPTPLAYVALGILYGLVPLAPRGPSQILAPNDVWSADDKGQLRTGDGRYCYPLTVADGFRRYLLGCQAFMATLCLFVWEAEKRRPSGLIIDAVEFHHRFADGVMSWRDARIIPRYGAAGVRRDPAHSGEIAELIADRLEGKPTPAEPHQQPRRDIIVYRDGDLVPAPLRPPSGWHCRNLGRRIVKNTSEPVDVVEARPSGYRLIL